MTTQYSLAEEDWFALNLHYAAQSGQMKRQRRIFLGLAGLMLADTLLLYFVHAASLSLLAGTVGLMALMMALFLPKLLLRNLRRQVQRGDFRALFGDYELTLLPSGVNVRGPIAESLYYWSAVEQIIEIETHLFIQFSSAVRLTIPKKAFTTPQQGAQFLRMAEEYRQAATGKPIPTTQRGSWWTQGTQVVETQLQHH